MLEENFQFCSTSIYRNIQIKSYAYLLKHATSVPTANYDLPSNAGERRYSSANVIVKMEVGKVVTSFNTTANH